jgi:hypothetical protein
MLQVNNGDGSGVITTKAEFFNSQTVKCVISDNGVYEVAVSNDGETVSDYKVYISYNSHCERCNQTGCQKRVKYRHTILCVKSSVLKEVWFSK